MKESYKFLLAFIIHFIVLGDFSFASNDIPADDPNIQYYGRWDFSDPLAPRHSWPGVYIYAEFEGTSIGIRTNDNGSYYNVFIDDTIFSVLHGIEREENIIPEEISLYQNYPNPFNPSTNIFFDLNKRSYVELKTYNLLGELIETLVNSELDPGKYNFKFDAKNYASGIYLYRLNTGSFNEVKKMILMK